MIVGFCGAGMMAEAMMKSMLGAGRSKSDILAYDVFAARLEQVQAQIGVQTTDALEQLCSGSDIIVIATKPQVMTEVLRDLKQFVRPKHLVVSIAAGVSLHQLQSALPKHTRVIRVMPNTPMMVGETAAAFCLGETATEQDSETIEAIMSASGGSVFRLQEKLIDAVTGLSGSGPAYVYLMIEALADGGVRAGLPRNIAQGLAQQTVFGAAKMVIESDQHPAQLKDAVCSPGGTTIAGVHQLELAGFRAALMNAVMAAADRSYELSKL